MWSKESPATDAINDSMIAGVSDAMARQQEIERKKWLEEHEIDLLSAIDAFTKHSDNNDN